MPMRNLHFRRRVQAASAENGRGMWILTSGPTREHIDDVRFLSNASSGRMGFEIARAAVARGKEVVIVQGPVQLEPPSGVRIVPVVSAREMLDAGQALLAEHEVEVLLGVAAVCDWRPAHRVHGKPPKSEGALSLDLVPNPDVLATLAAPRRARLHVGFALQDFDAIGGRTEGVEIARSEAFEAAAQKARDKIERKGLDAIILNGKTSMESVSSRAWWLDASGACAQIEGRDKEAIAHGIVARCCELLSP